MDKKNEAAIAAPFKVTLDMLQNEAKQTPLARFPQLRETCEGVCFGFILQHTYKVTLNVNCLG